MSPGGRVTSPSTQAMCGRGCHWPIARPSSAAEEAIQRAAYWLGSTAAHIRALRVADVVVGWRRAPPMANSRRKRNEDVVVAGEVRSRWSALASTLCSSTSSAGNASGGGVRRLRLSSQPHSGTCHPSVHPSVHPALWVVWGEQPLFLAAAASTWAQAQGCL